MITNTKKIGKTYMDNEGLCHDDEPCLQVKQQKYISQIVYKKVVSLSKSKQESCFWRFENGEQGSTKTP
jgi:hypothetical protein